MVTSFSSTPTVALFVPGNRPERFDKAVASGADAVILDLEDAVAGEHKRAAGAHVVEYLQRNPHLMVRINARSTSWFEEDLAALATTAVAAVMLPKAESADDVTAVCARLSGKVRVVPLIESARGLARLEQILGCDNVWCAAFGSLDFALDLDCAPTWEALLLARTQLVLHSRLANLPPPLDGVTAAFDQPALAEDEARRAAQLGFGGKLAIHPRQVEPITRGFQPDEATWRWAETVVAAARAGDAAQLNGAMIDRPVLERALRILTKVRRVTDRV